MGYFSNRFNPFLPWCYLFTILAPMCDVSDGCEKFNDSYSILGSTHPASHHSRALQVVYLINALQWKILSRWWNSYTVSVTSSADTYVFSPPNARPTTTMPRKDRVHNSHHLAQKLSLMLWWSLQFSQKGQLNSVTNGFPIVRGCYWSTYDIYWGSNSSGMSYANGWWWQSMSFLYRKCFLLWGLGHLRI